VPAGGLSCGGLNLLQNERAYRRFAWCFLATYAASLTLVGALIFCIDPYEAFTLSPRWGHGTGHLRMSKGYLQETRYLVPRLARNAAFDSAIVGSSVCQAASPNTLGGYLEGSWVNLCLGGATITEQAFALRVFLAHHSKPKTILWALFSDICLREPGPQFSQFASFPTPLYAPTPDHLGLLFNSEAVEQAWLQVRERFELGLLPAVDLPDSYYYDGDWDVFHSMPFDLSAKGIRSRIYSPAAEAGRSVLDRSLDAAFPRLSYIIRALDEAPPETRKLLVLMPMHRYAVPAEDSASGRRLAQCATELSDLARRSGGKFLPAFTTSSVPQNDFVWFDYMHLQRSGLDMLIREISLDLGRVPGAPPPLEGSTPGWSHPQIPKPWPSPAPPTPWPSSQPLRPWPSPAAQEEGR
jgi:hypothetical protein